MLTCGCNTELELDPGQKGYYYPEDFEKLKTSRRKRCKSCGKLIDIGSFVVSFNWFKSPEHEVEVNIYGEDGEIPVAPTYFCETCGEIYLNLMDIGYCIQYDDDMRDALKKYHRIVAASVTDKSTPHAQP